MLNKFEIEIEINRTRRMADQLFDERSAKALKTYTNELERAADLIKNKGRRFALSSSF
ncbi:hypothetical protein [Sphingomonas echinoides]|uniref:hypothetical protein n=1 Tax=Sphingomonas echinoides TaxID=59803 RepID=UPI00241318FC|nr:hypothetical protein [Sphingomonas echinoides]